MPDPAIPTALEAAVNVLHRELESRRGTLRVYEPKSGFEVASAAIAAFLRERAQGNEDQEMYAMAEWLREEAAAVERAALGASDD